MANRLQKMFFMLWKLKKDLVRDRQIYQLTDDLHSSQLGEYYFLMTEEQMLAGHSQQFHFDEQGIPIIPSYIDVEDQRMVYYPISIGQFGLAIWHTFLRTRSEQDKKRFLTIADWFYENRIEDSRLGNCWLTDVDKPAYRIKKPWKSAFSQARAINILLRAFQLTGDNRYWQCAEKALLPFQFSVKDGGVTTYLQEGPFYEEYPAADIPVLVLNGMIFSLCGIYDFLRVFPGHPVARKIYDEGITTLVKILPRYDMGFWSKYSLCEAEFHPVVDPATIGYHHLHIIQLELLFRLSRIPTLQEYAERWKGYVNKINILRMYWKKFQALQKMNRL